MSHLARVALTLVLAASSSTLTAQQPPAAPAQPATLAQLAWIAGHWVDDSGGNLSEEIWTAPSGDSMLGMWRYVARGRMQISELLSIKEEDGGPVFRLRHFDPRMAAREEKDTPLALKLVSIREREAAFEGPGQPTGTVRLTYRRTGPDTLAVTLDRDGTSQGFQFRRQRP
jgi:uncharacterized protein DUF6265